MTKPDYEEVWPALIQSGIYGDLEGTIDIHCQPNPDFCPRLLGDTDLVAIAKAVMILSHFSSTHERAYLAEKAVGGA